MRFTQLIFSASSYNYERTIFGKKAWPGTIIAHEQTKIFTTEKRRMINLLKNGHSYSYLPCNIKSHTERSLRSNRKLMLITARSNYTTYDKSSTARSRKYWNKLPEDIKRIRDFDKFKIRIKMEMLLNNINFPE